MGSAARPEDQKSQGCRASPGPAPPRNVHLTISNECDACRIPRRTLAGGNDEAAEQETIAVEGSFFSGPREKLTGEGSPCWPASTLPYLRSRITACRRWA